MSIIIGITGVCEDPAGHRRMAGSGKSVVAKRLVSKHGFADIAWADPMKRFCREVFQFSDEQLWGDSDERIKPDKRYPRPKDHLLEGSAEVTVHDVEYLTPRYALQSLGTGWGRGCYNDVWVKYGLRQARDLMEDTCLRYSPQRGVYEPDGEDWGPNGREPSPHPEGVVFSDLRYFNEYYGVRDNGGLVVRVHRCVDTPFDMKSMDHTHSSEKELLLWDDAKFDYIIENNTDLHGLALLVDRMVDIFKGRILPYDEAQADVPPLLRK